MLGFNVMGVWRGRGAGDREGDIDSISSLDRLVLGVWWGC